MVRMRGVVIPAFTSLYLFWSAFGFAQSSPSPTHPLEPLTVREIAAAVRLLRAHAAVPSGAFFPTIALHEPPKAEVEWLGAYAEAPVDDLLVDPTPVVRDAMDMISQGFGFPRSPCFDATTGGWRS